MPRRTPLHWPGRSSNGSGGVAAGGTGAPAIITAATAAADGFAAAAGFVADIVVDAPKQPMVDKPKARQPVELDTEVEAGQQQKQKQKNKQQPGGGTTDGAAWAISAFGGEVGLEGTVSTRCREELGR